MFLTYHFPYDLRWRERFCAGPLSAGSSSIRNCSPTTSCSRTTGRATLDLSESRVSQIHSSILARLKAQMADRRKEFQQAAAV
jgi:hypothetical protein